MLVSVFYERIGGDYEDIKNRLRSDDLIKKFLLKFENETSYEDLLSAVQEKNIEKTIEAAHKLKGITANLSFCKLHEALTTLLRLLREEKQQTVDEELMQQITGHYEQIIKALREM